MLEFMFELTDLSLETLELSLARVALPQFPTVKRPRDDRSSPLRPSLQLSLQLADLLKETTVLVGEMGDLVLQTGGH